MLVLSRKINEGTVVLHKGGLEVLAKITVLNIQGNRVKLGIEASSEVPIYRWETWEGLQDKQITCNNNSDRGEHAKNESIL